MLIDIPLIVQIILIAIAWVMWKVLPSRVPWRIAIIGVAVLLSVFLWESAFYLHETTHYPLRISTAIDYHFRTHKSLPDDPSDIEYGACQSFVRYMIRNRKGRKNFIEMYKQIKAGVPVETAMNATFGMGTEEFYRKWRDAID